LHLTSGNLYNTELFLGNDNLYVKLANTGNVVINSNDNVGNSAQWTFGTNGTLTAPGIIKTGVFVSGNIPSASAVGVGARAFVTDADSVVFGNTYVGGAANSMPVFSNGTAWYIG
jgi:hypothetical protein